jgi:hypothetical protein
VVTGRRCDVIADLRPAGGSANPCEYGVGSQSAGNRFAPSARELGTASAYRRGAFAFAPCSIGRHSRGFVLKVFQHKEANGRREI